MARDYDKRPRRIDIGRARTPDTGERAHTGEVLAQVIGDRLRDHAAR